MEEKKLTDEEVIKVLEACYTDKYNCDDCPLCLNDMPCNTDINPQILDLIHRLQNENAEQKAEIKRLTEEIDQRRELMHRMDCNYATELQKNAELQKQVDELKRENAKVISFNDALYREKEQAVKDTAKEILDELDLFFKGTTFRKGYEFKKIDEKLKEIAERKGVEVE